MTLRFGGYPQADDGDGALLGDPVDRPHPILDQLCGVPVCLHAVRDHFQGHGPCAACYAAGVLVICRGLYDRRWPKAPAREGGA